MGSLQVGTKPQGGSEYKQNINEPLIPSCRGGKSALVYSDDILERWKLKLNIDFY